MSQNNYRQAWENVPLSKLSIKFRGDLSSKISGKWKHLARSMNIDPENEVISHVTSRNSIDLSNEFLSVAAEKGCTVGAMNEALNDQGLPVYMLEESDVNSATATSSKPVLDISFNEVSPASRFGAAKKIAPYWKAIAGPFGLLENMLLCSPYKNAEDQAFDLMSKLSSRMIKLSEWNALAAEGLIPVAVEVDGEIQKIGYDTWKYKIKLVAVPQPASAPVQAIRQAAYQPVSQQFSQPMAVDRSQHMAVDTPQTKATPPLTETEKVLAKYAKYCNEAFDAKYFELLVRNHEKTFLEFVPLILLLPFLGIENNDLSEAALHKAFTYMMIIAFSLKNKGRDVFQFSCGNSGLSFCPLCRTRAL